MIPSGLGQVWTGDQMDCDPTKLQGWHVVHACKAPCYLKFIGRRPVNQNSPLYLSAYMLAPGGSDLYLNMIDPEQPLFDVRMFGAFLDYVRYVTKQPKWKLLIHCNQGRSRSPSLVMLAAAAIFKAVPGGSYDAARVAFDRIYPGFYEPRAGIETFLRGRWADLTRSPAAGVTSAQPFTRDAP